MRKQGLYNPAESTSTIRFHFKKLQPQFMSVLIFADQSDGQLKKSSYEALTYGAKVAEILGTDAEALVLGNV